MEILIVGGIGVFLVLIFIGKDHLVYNLFSAGRRAATGESLDEQRARESRAREAADLDNARRWKLMNDAGILETDSDGTTIFPTRPPDDVLRKLGLTDSEHPDNDPKDVVDDGDANDDQDNRRGA